MSESLSFDLIVRDHSDRGLNKFADNLDRAGRKAKKAGADSSEGLDKAGDSAEKAAFEFKALAVAGALIGPAIVPGVAAAVPLVVGLTGALAGAGAAGKLFGAVFTSTLEEVKESADDLDSLQEKIDAANQAAASATQRGDGEARTAALKAQTKAQQEYADALALMPPKQRQAVQEYRSMAAAWQGFVDKNKPATYGILSQGYGLIKAGLAEAQPLFDVAARSAGGFLDRLKEWADSGGLRDLVLFLSAQATGAFASFEVILRNLARGFGPLFKLSAGQGQGFLIWLTQMSGKLAAFGQGGGWTTFVSYTSSQGPALMSLLTSIGTSLVTLVQAVTPLAPVSLAIAGALAQLIAAVPPPVLTAIVAGFVAYQVAMAAYNGYATLAAVATKVWTAGQWLLNAAMSANPIGLVVIAIAALVAIVVVIAKRTTWFQQLWAKAWPAIQRVGEVVWKAVQVAAQLAFKLIAGYVRFYIGTVRAILSGLRSFAVGAWRAISTAAQRVWSAVTGFVRTAVQRHRELLQTIVTKARDILGKIRSIFSPSALYNAGAQLIKGLTRGITNAMGGAVDAVKSGLGRIKGMLPGSPIRTGPLKNWNNGGAGKRLMDLVASGIRKGAPGVSKEMSAALTVARKGSSVLATVSRAGALGRTSATKESIANRLAGARGEIADITSRHAPKKTRSSVGGSSGGGGGLTININAPFGTPEQIAKALIKAMSEYKSNGGSIPVGTFQGGSI